MFLTFFKIHEKTFKERSWTFNENQNDDQMRWVFCLLFFSFIIVDTSLSTIWHESFTKITLLLSVSLCSTIICIYTILSLLTSELMEPFFFFFVFMNIGKKPEKSLKINFFIAKYHYIIKCTNTAVFTDRNNSCPWVRDLKGFVGNFPQFDWIPWVVE